MVKRTELEYQTRIAKRWRKIAELETEQQTSKIRLKIAKHRSKIAMYEYLIDFWKGEA